VLTPGQFDRHLVGALTVLAEHAGDAGLVAERDGVAIAALGRGPDEFNSAWVLQSPSDPRTTLAWAHARLAERPPPHMVQVPAACIDATDEVLRDLGLRDSHRTPGMVRSTTTDVPPLPAGLRVLQVRDAGALEAHVVATAAGFGMPDTTVLDGVMPPSLLDDDRVALFNGHVDDAESPSATAISVVSEGVAGIYAVSVHESARRRGFGTAMTWAAIAAGCRDGVDAAVLQASTTGRPVYERMGFVQVRVHHRYRQASET
jgi:ribosomal protein S18 acetylase RimI-like enzyme